ncbi:hypothetical protein HPB52_010547 [Rhipicephalus sanguineus]|uniref:Uncharacterized protein n=1 Tax=Rhipicephalus sanguineus TaxID=34632 RepID=A0A9D4SP27_RHISA|nr:hypothetical protein HPB52_010547 [Rhipicephalus sanguineus]
MEPSEVTSESDSLLPNEPCVASMSTPPRSVGKNKSGHILNNDSRNMIFHCYTYWRNREPERSVEDTSKFVAEMLGVSESTVFKVRREAKASSSSGGNLSTPSRKRPRNAEKRRRSTKYDSFTLCALRSCVHDFFRRNEIPTVEKITNEFSNRMDLPSLKRCAVRRLLAEIGFKYEKRCRNSLLIDRDDIVEWRLDSNILSFLDGMLITEALSPRNVAVNTVVKMDAPADFVSLQMVDAHVGFLFDVFTCAPVLRQV